MSVIEGIVHNPDRGIYEPRLIACDTKGRLLGAQTEGSPESGMHTDVFAVSRFGCGESAATDPVDLGESHGYRLLIARKLCTTSRNDGDPKINGVCGSMGEK